MFVRAAIRHAGIPTQEVGPHAALITTPTEMARYYVRRAVGMVAPPFFRGASLQHPGQRAYHSIPHDISTHRFVFAFIRNPLSYYRSYWTYKMEYGWDPCNTFDMHYHTPLFEEFVQKVTAEYPGWITRLFQEYIGSFESPRIHFIGKQETLTNDLLEALEQAGEEVDDQLIRQTQPRNTSLHSPYAAQALYTARLREKVRQSEKDIFTHFDYESDDAPYVEVATSI